MNGAREFGYAESDFAREGVNIWLGERLGDDARLIVQLGGRGAPVIVRPDLEAGTLDRTAPSIFLSDGLARTLYATLGRFYGPDGHDNATALRKDYDAERGRVDKLTDALVGIAATVTRQNGA